MKRTLYRREAEPMFLCDKEHDILDRSFRFATDCVRLRAKLDEKPGVGRVLMSQILRAATSVGANLEEAQAAQSREDFISKVSISLKEARETHFRLRVLGNSRLFSLPELSGLIDEALELRRILGATILVTTKRNSSEKLQVQN